MKHYYILILLAAALGFSGCESDNPTSNSNDTKKELEVLPTSITIERFKEFSIKARMTNTALSDVYITIDFGDGKTPSTTGAGSEISHSYTEVGTFTITFSAYDAFTKLLIATKTITAVVNDITPIVSFARSQIDTTIETTFAGALDGIYFPATSNVPFTKFVCDFGDGIQMGTVQGLSLYHEYESPGTYTVRVDGYDDKNNYLASDTMTCTVRLPAITLSMLTSAKSISVSFSPDNTSPIYTAIDSLGYLDAEIAFQNYFEHKASWNGNNYDVRYTIDSGGNQRALDHHFSGTISSDLQKITEMNVSIYDSIKHMGSIQPSKYGYRLNDLELSGINSEIVVYRAAYRQLSSFASNEYASSLKGKSMWSIGNLSNHFYYIHSIAARHPPYAYVIFSRK
ncbi:MAG TPA: PKD domain-containing protein [Candidatus Kapabacteria bacterium]